MSVVWMILLLIVVVFLGVSLMFAGEIRATRDRDPAATNILEVGLL